MKLSPDDQFTPTEENVTDILEHYGLGFVAYQEASSGIENRTLIVDTSKEKYVVRIYRHKKKQLEAIHLELDFMEHLRAHDIKIPPVMVNKEGQQVTVQYLQGKIWQIIVMGFAEGEHAKMYTEALLQDLAQIQAKMHNLSSAYSGEFAAAARLTKLRESHFIKNISRKAIQDERLLPFLQRAENYTVELSPDLPRGLCHLDYNKDNTLAKNGFVSAVLDFDDLAIAPFVVCLAYTLWDVYTKAGEKATKDYLEQYEKLRKLSETEQNYIRSVMLFRHYVMSAIKILNSHTSTEEILRYIDIEDKLREPSVQDRHAETT